MILSENAAGHVDLHERAQAVPIGLVTNEFNLKKVHRSFLSQVIDEHLRPIIEIVRYDVQVPIIVQVEDGGRAAAESAHDGLPAGLPFTERALFIGAIAIENKPRLLGPASPARLNAKDELAIIEATAAVVQD